MIVDSHVHLFPYLGGSNGFMTAADHMRYIQFNMVTIRQPVRRMRDNSPVADAGLALSEFPPDSPAKLREVNFHVEDMGRFVWRHSDGSDVYLHLMPPSLQSMESSPEFMIAQMNHAGVDVGVIQNMPIYGFLNEYTSAAAAKFPSRLVGLAAIDELRSNEDSEVIKLRSYVKNLGLRGLYYHLRGFFYDAYRSNFDHPKYEPFWDLVESLGIPVFWDPKGVPINTPESQAAQYAHIDKWAARHPNVVSVLTHGLHPSLVLDGMPDGLARLLARPNVFLEVLYPIDWGFVYDYPYAELRPVLRELYRRVGGSRLVWGSDMPNVERLCTYRQSLEYLRKYCDFIPSSDMDLILGNTLASLFSLRTAA